MRAKLSVVKVVLWAGAATLLAACAAKPVQPDIINVNGLIPIADTVTLGVHAYRAPNLDRSRYRVWHQQIGRIGHC